MNLETYIGINIFSWLLTDIFISRPAVARYAISSGKNIAALGTLTTLMVYVSLIVSFVLLNWKLGVLFLILEFSILTIISAKFNNWFHNNSTQKIFTMIYSVTILLVLISCGLTINTILLLNN